VLLAGVFVLLLAFLLFPFQIEVVSRWSLHIVDDNGAPLPNMNVTEHWRHYLLESADHKDLKRTDAGAIVDFPARTIRASFASRMFYRLLKLTSQGVAAKHNPAGSVVVWGNPAYETTVSVYNPNAPPSTEVVVPRVR